eukprot:CAMPEP_0203663810 /NCGR_PEP_ID=MMETSP0090-20130426/1345_1 /ASSEMBLY_ACC=CAM_ASM_001088 /TAXON_ID=426623 /ORGANISM="Chaetoceros affinis, Strain CCMP159" /LENGTH=1077 /DNA_ID=CAMNT_0050526847 /DNA_START=293 /DNA_END=3526 /DNA_ORIENTATION=+
MNVIQNIEQLHQCIVLATTASSSSSTAASSMLDVMCTSQDGGSKICIALLRQIFEKLGSSIVLQSDVNGNQQIISVMFYALSTIQRALSKSYGANGMDGRNSNSNSAPTTGIVIVDESSRLDLRQIIMNYIFCFSATAEVTNEVVDANYNLMPKYLRTKIGVVLSLLVRVDFPERWPNVFNELIQALHFDLIDQNIVALPRTVVLEVQRKDIFLRMLDAFCDEVVEKTQYEKNTLIKDAVRGFSIDRTNSPLPPERSISAALVETIFRIFQWSYPFMNKQSDGKVGSHEMQKLPVKAMSVLGRFIPWIELSLILNDSITSLFFSCLSSAGPGDPDDDDGSLSSQLAVQVLECFKEIVSKGMETSKKVGLIMNLRILERISECNLNLVDVDGTHITVVIKVAELINLIGFELLTFWDSHCLDALPSSNSNEIVSLTTELNRLVNLFFYVFAYDDIDVSGAILPLAVRMMATLEKEICKKREDLPFRMSAHIEQLMAVMFNQMQYPTDFDFDYEDEDDAEEEMYRNELRKLNQAITRICPNENLQFICKALSKIELPLSSAPTPIMEAALRLVYHYCEGIRPVPGINVVMKNETFREILISLHSSDIMAHHHREVLLLYYDISVRYSKILKERSDLLPNLLNAISGSRGLQHDHRRVRSRSCYFLLKLVKALGTLIRPYVEGATKGILELLSNESTRTLNPDDSLYLFETIGLLLGKAGLDEASQRDYLAAVITPHIKRIQSILNDPNLQHDPDYFGGILAYNLAGLAFLSKGFTKKVHPDVQLVLLETVPIALQVLRLLPNHTQVRDKCMIYLQRMILCLGEKVLPSIPNFLELLIEHCNNDDILYVSQLLNQLCFKFRNKAIPTIDGTTLPFLKKCQNSLPNDAQVFEDMFKAPPHLMTEQHAILKIMFAFLHQIVSTLCTEVLISSTNVSSLELILRTMGEGAVLVSDPVMKKTCIQFFRELITQWMSKDCTVAEVVRIRSGFAQYVLKIFLPKMVNYFVGAEFNIQDANQYRVMREVVAGLADIKSRCSNEEFEEFISSCNVPTEIAGGLRQAQTPADMEACLKGIISKVEIKNF